MKRTTLFLLAMLVAGAGLLLWTRTAGRKEALHPAERFRLQTAAALSREFPLGIITTSALPADPVRLENGFIRLRERGARWACLEAGTNRVSAQRLIQSSRKAGIRLFLSTQEAAVPAAAPDSPFRLQAAGSAIVGFWKGLDSRPEAILLSSRLTNEEAIAAYAPYAIAIATNLVPAFAITPAELAGTFARLVPASPVLACALSAGSADDSLDVGRFVALGQSAVAAAAKAGMTPVFLLPPERPSSLRHSAGTAMSWQVWASIALGARGILLEQDGTQWPPSLPPVFSELAPFHPLMRRLEPCPDYLGNLMLTGTVYPGDLARLFLDSRRKSFVAVIVQSPLRPQGSAITLRGGPLAPLQGSPPLGRLRPGQGGFYKLVLPPATASVLREARSLSILPRPLRDRLFIPTYGSEFSVLCDRDNTPRILHAQEPVALLVEPDIHLEPLAGSPARIPQPARHYPSFRKAHIDGYSLYRITLSNRYHRLIILEEDGSTPGYNERVASMSNVGVTRNGICPMPVRKGVLSADAGDCHLTYDLDAFRAVSGLSRDYPLYFQFDGANTLGKPDTRFHVWTGPARGDLTERVSPGKPAPLVYLEGTDKWLKIGMPYRDADESQPVLQRWSFFTWIQADPSEKE